MTTPRKSRCIMLDHPMLGPVRVTLRSGMSARITARWKQGYVQVNAPASTRPDELSRAIESLAPKLLETRKVISYTDGQKIEMPGLTIAIRRQSLRPDRILATARLPLSVIEVGTALDMDSTDTSRAIGRMMCGIAKRLAPQLIMDRAREIAAHLGTRPAAWAIMNGHRVMGKCTAAGVIHLSYALVFLPTELRDYIVCHELAHLKEMNHSPRFHAVCNAYCNGREAELKAKLKAYRWPFMRR